MKKLAIMVLIGAMCVSVFAGCGKKEEETTVPSAVEPSIVEVEVIEEEPVVEEVNTHEGQKQADLTGEWVSIEEASQRPFALMMGNTTAALPQYGISYADVIYEAPVEGQYTRLMPIWQKYQDVEKIMSTRSCRLYYIDWALEFDAVYGHYGQAYLAKDMLAKSYVNNLSGLDGAVEKVMYKRDNSKKAPHNAYTTGSGITAGIELKGYSKTHADDYPAHYQFAKEADEQVTLDNGSDAGYIKLNCYQINTPSFVYDKETGLYARYQYGDKQIDGLNNEQVKVKNIIIQVCQWSVADSEKGYLAVNTTSGGKGYFVTNGKAIPVTWSKASQTAPTKYFMEDGTEITLNQGKTWVCIVQDTYASDITFSADKPQ